VRYGTECPKAPHSSFGESMVIPRPGQDDLPFIPPPGEIVWSGIHHIWGRPTTITSYLRPLALPSVVVSLEGCNVAPLPLSARVRVGANGVLAHIVSWDASPSTRSCYDKS